MQQLPFMNVKPFMTINVRRNKVIHYLLGKTSLSFFNFMAIFMFLPFSIVLLTKGYNTVQVICWFLSIIFLTLSVNYLNFLINKNNTIFYIMTGLLIVLIGLEYYGIFAVSQPIGAAFNTMYTYPFLMLVPLALMVSLYYINFTYIRKGFYLDDAVSKKVEEVNATDLSWMDRFGSVAPFLKNDIKLIWRNARPKQVIRCQQLSFCNSYGRPVAIVIIIEKRH